MSARQLLRESVRRAMQTAEELEGHMPTGDYIALMQDIAKDASERARVAAANDQERRVREADRLVNALVDAQAAYANAALTGTGEEAREKAEAVDAAREALVEFVTRSAPCG